MSKLALACALALAACATEEDPQLDETEQAVAAPCSISISGPATATFGQNIHLVATASCTGGTPEIQWFEKKSNVNTVIGAFSTATTFDFVADQAGPSIMFMASVRRQGVTGEAAVNSPMIGINVADNVPACTNVKLTSPAMNANVAVGQPLSLTATATCGALAPEFQFWFKLHSTSTWTVLNPTSYVANGGSLSFTPDASMSGQQLDFSAAARAVGGHVKYSGRSMAVTVTAGSSSGTPGCTITLSLPANGTYDAPMHLVATATCNTGPAEVNFLHHEGNAYVSISNGFHASQTIDFASHIVGMNYFIAQARTQGTTSPVKGTPVTSVIVADNVPSCTMANVTSPTKNSTFATGSLVTLAATAVCPAGTSPEFQFWVKPSTASTYTVLPGYTTTSMQWDTTSFGPPGTWNIVGAARAIGAHSAYQAHSMPINVTLQ